VIDFDALAGTTLQGLRSIDLLDAFKPDESVDHIYIHIKHGTPVSLRVQRALCAKERRGHAVSYDTCCGTVEVWRMYVPSTLRAGKEQRAMDLRGRA
jgi:hypothetical protein